MDDLLAAVLATLAEAALELAGELLISLFARALMRLIAGIAELGAIATAVGVAIPGLARENLA